MIVMYRRIPALRERCWHGEVDRWMGFYRSVPRSESQALAGRLGRMAQHHGPDLRDYGQHLHDYAFALDASQLR